MKLNEIKDNPGATQSRTRVGRGEGSGKGKTSGRGQKGQKSRSGVSVLGFEGGQMPLYRRLPKRGFHNPFSKNYDIVNVGRLQKAIDDKKLDPKQTINSDALKAAGLASGKKDGVRILGSGELGTKITVDVAGASKSAIEIIEKAGGTVTVPEKIAKPSKKGRRSKAMIRAEKEANPGKAAEAPDEKAAGTDDGDDGEEN